MAASNRRAGRTKRGLLLFPTTRDSPSSIRRASPSVRPPPRKWRSSACCSTPRRSKSGCRRIFLQAPESSTSIHRAEFSGARKNPLHATCSGLRQEWTDAGTRRAAYYTNIPPGNYKFRVQASNQGQCRGLAKERLPHPTPALLIKLGLLLVHDCRRGESRRWSATGCNYASEKSPFEPAAAGRPGARPTSANARTNCASPATNSRSGPGAHPVNWSDKQSLEEGFRRAARLS